MSSIVTAWVAALALLSLAWPAASAAKSAPTPPAISGAASVLTSFWEDAAQREVFVVAGDRYELRFSTHPARLLTVRVDGNDLLASGGAAPWAELPDGARLVPAPRGFAPSWEVHTGQKSAQATSSAARMNVWRATPVYWEIQLRDIPLVPASNPGAAAPLRVHLVVHAHPDRAHLELRAEPEGAQPAPVSLGWSLAAPADAAHIHKLDTREVLAWPGRAVLLAAPGGIFFTDATITARAPAASAWFVLRPAKANVPLATLLNEELQPLPTADFSASRGVWTGYDAASGLYRIQVLSQRQAFTFDAAHKNPGRRLETALTVPATADPRRVTVLAATGLGNLPAAVLADPHGFPRPVPAFVAKNFSGENEESDDTAFGDILFPLALGPDQAREHRLVGLFQTWGANLVKQVSSIRFSNIYWHLSNGLSETTCFTHAWMHLRGALVSAPDYRPYSGPFLQGQPQHDCFSWPGFLHYETENGPARPMYRRTDFHSVAPSLARFTMHFRTSDDAADMRVEVLEMPQSDEARTFLRLRYQWDRATRVQGDARHTFRWLQTFEKYPARELLWLPDEGAGRTLALSAPGSASPSPQLLAEPLALRAPYAGVHEQRDHFGSIMLVTRLAGRLGGREVERVHLTADFDERQGAYAFVHDQPELSLETGDWLEADVLLMPHGEVTQPLHKAERERTHWAIRAPRITRVETGRKIADFPPTVRADQDVARFNVTGGLDALAIVAEGFSGPGVPLLWKDAVWQNPQRHGGDGHQVDRDPADGTHRFTFVYPIRRAEEHALTVSRLAVTGAEVAALEDNNGLPVARLTGEGDFRITSPVLFFPGTNRVTAGSGLIVVEGRGTSLCALPHRFSPDAGEAELAFAASDEARVAFNHTGSGGSLVLGQRVPGRSYRLVLDTGHVASAVAASSGEVGFPLPDSPASIAHVGEVTPATTQASP